MIGPSSIPVAGVITEWRHNSHADVLLSRLLEPEAWRHRTPFALKLVSVYADQFPAKGDLCRESCRKHNVPIFPTIREAIGLGTPRVAVKGVLLIGEHGAYPINSRGQWVYPPAGSLRASSMPSAPWEAASPSSRTSICPTNGSSRGGWSTWPAMSRSP